MGETAALSARDEFAGILVAVVLRADDIEDKLVVADTVDWPTSVIERAISFQERFFDSTVVSRPA